MSGCHVAWYLVGLRSILQCRLHGSLERIPLLQSEDDTEVSGKLGRIGCTDVLVQVKLGARAVQREARSMYS